MPSLREQLRVATSEAHDRVDRLYGALCLTKPDDLARFLHAHALALNAIENAIAAHRPESDCPLTLSGLARADLATLGAPAPEPHPFPELSGAHADGLSYVIAGAHLGAAVMRGQWSRATDPKVRGAGRFLEAQDMKSYWPGFIARLNGTVCDGATEAAIVGAAIAAFAAFERAFAVATDTLERQAHGAS